MISLKFEALFSGLQKPASTQSVVIILSGFVCFLVLLANWNFNPPNQRETPVSRAITLRIKKLAVETHGDPGRLSRADRQWLDKMTMGHTGFALKMMLHREVDSE